MDTVVTSIIRFWCLQESQLSLRTETQQLQTAPPHRYAPAAGGAGPLETARRKVIHIRHAAHTAQLLVSYQASRPAHTDCQQQG